MRKIFVLFFILCTSIACFSQETEAQLDAKRRQFIENFLKEYEQAYEQKRIEFIRDFFSQYALIITETTEKGDKKIFNLTRKGDEAIPTSSKSRPYITVIEDRDAYIKRLSEIFNSEKSISLSLTKSFIEQSRINKRIYGVNFMQQWNDNQDGQNLEDDMLGYVFMMVDFQNGSSEPIIHVRTWQPKQNITKPQDKYFLKDFTIYDTQK